MRFLLAALLLAAPLSADEAEKIEITFAPADGTVWQGEYESRRTVAIGDDTPRTDSSSNKTRMAIAKQESGYHVTTATSETSLKSNGHEITNPMLKASEGVELVYVVEPDGQCTDVRGYEKVLESLKEKLPGPFFQQLSPLFNSAGLRKRDIAVWNQRVGSLAGKTVTFGDVWVKQETANLPNGKPLVYYTATTVKGWADCGESRCLELAVASHTDREKLAADLGEKGAAALAEIAEPEGEQAEGTITATGTRIIDPTTARIHSDTLKRVSKGKGVIGGRGEETFEIVEQHSYQVRTGS